MTTPSDRAAELFRDAVARIRKNLADELEAALMEAVCDEQDESPVKDVTMGSNSLSLHTMGTYGLETE